MKAKNQATANQITTKPPSQSGNGGNGNGGKAPLRIVEFRAEQVKRLSAVTIRPPEDQSVVLLTGKNRQGKSSIIDAIWMALGGKAAIPSKPIRSGAQQAECSLDLGEFIVTRRFTEAGEYLAVTTRDGFKAPKPQEFLNSRLAGRAQNPLEFMRLSPTEQVKALQGMVSIKLDLEEFGKISGLPTKKIKGDDNPIEVIDEAYKFLFGKRTDINKEVARLKGAVESISLEIPADQKDLQPVSASALIEEREALRKLAAEKEGYFQSAWSLQQKVIGIQKTVKEKEFQVTELKARIVKLEGECRGLRGEAVSVAGKRDEAQTKFDAMAAPDFTDVDTRIAAVDATNDIAAKVKSLGEQQAALDLVRGDSEDLTQKLTAIKEYKTQLIQEAGLPVPGLGFEDGEVAFGGIPLSQASGREQIEISCAICAAQNPAIGILTIDIGWSELDADGKTALEEFARERGLQIWTTQVLDEPGERGFHIYDGELVAVDGAAIETIQNETKSDNSIPGSVDFNDLPMSSKGGAA